MSSNRRIQASQANGCLSRGPVTAAGKLISSQNAVTHGLLSCFLVLEDESTEAFQALLDQHVARLQPADGLEFALIEEMVASMWRLRRSWAIETRTLDTAPVDPATVAGPMDRIASAFSGAASAPTLPLLHRYETRLHMMYQRALHNLLLLRAAVPNEPSPISEQPQLALE
jgi:hypothetical protein